MALSKTLSFPNGTSGSYIRLTSYRWDRTLREASAIFALFADADHAASAGDTPLLAVLAKLRLTGAKFDQYLGNAALAGHDVLGQLYLAAKAERLIPGGGLTSLNLADAADV